MSKRENISIITAGDRYGWRRTGKARELLGKAAHLPVVGSLIDTVVSDTVLNREPLEMWRRKMEKTNREERLTEIPFGTDNRTLMLTTGLDSLMMLTDAKAWEKERLQMAEGLRKGMFDANGDYSYHTWLIARSSLGPKVLSNVVHGVLRDGKPFPTFPEILNLYEREENPELRRKQFIADAAITLTSMVGPGLADYLLLKMLPSTPEVVQNPELAGTYIAGALIGATAGVLTGGVIDALPAKDLDNLGKTLIPIGTGVLGLMGAYFYVENVIVPGIQQTIQVTHVPMNEYGWTIPVVSVAGGLVFGYPRFRRHQKARDTIALQLEDLRSWKSMLAIMSNSLGVMSKVNDHMSAHPPDDAKAQRVASNIYGKHPALSQVVEQYHFREPDDVAAIQALAGDTLKDLAEQVLFAEMISFFQSDAAVNPDGKPNPTVKGLIPTADKYFASLDREGLTTASSTCDLVKALGDKGEYVAALTVISPTLAQIMITQDQMGKLGANDDTQHFGEAYMNTGTMGVFVKLVENTFTKLSTVRDSKRAVLTNMLQKLGKQYTAAIPIGGLDRIYNTPSHMNLGALYGYAYLRARPHEKPDPGQADRAGIYGSKGLLSDVGKAALESMKVNPLITYMFLADISVAIENVDNLLVSVSPNTRSRISKALVSLQREVATAILKERLPRNKETAVKFFTDGDYAMEAYIALTMLTEVCGASVTEPILAREAAVLSPLFAEDDITTANPVVIEERMFPSVVKFNGIVGDTPNLYTTQVIDFIHVSNRHSNPVHQKMAEFLQRGMLPLLIREYFERLKPGGRGELFDKEQMANTREFAGYGLETVHRQDLEPLACDLITILDIVNRTTMSGVAPMGMMQRPSEDIQRQAESAYRRTQTLIDVASRLLSSRERELAVLTGPNGANMKTEMERQIKEISEKVGTAVTTRFSLS